MCLAAAGLAAGPFLSTRGGFLAAGVMAAFAWAARASFRAAGAAAAVVIVALGVGHARSQALEPRAVPAGALRPGTVATLQEAPRQERFGWRAVAVIEGTRVLLRGRGSRPTWRAGEIVGVSGSSRPLREEEGWLRNRGVVAVADLGEHQRAVGERLADGERLSRDQVPERTQSIANRFVRPQHQIDPVRDVEIRLASRLLHGPDDVPRQTFVLEFRRDRDVQQDDAVP